MTTRKLLHHVSLYPILARYRLKRDVPKGTQDAVVAVNFGLWGVWYCVRGFAGYRMVDGREMPLHEMRLLDGRVVLGQRDLTAADGTPIEEAWRESVKAKIAEDLSRSAQNFI